MNEAMKKQAETLKNDRPLIQSWMNDNIKTTPVGALAVYNGVKSKLSVEMNEQTFRTTLSLNIKLGFITGFTGQKGRGGGYIPSHLVKVSEKAAPSGDSAAPSAGVTGGVRVGTNLLAPADSLNWSITRKSGPKLFYTSIERAMARLTDLSLEDKLKDKLSSEVVTIDHVLKAIESAKAEILAAIVKVNASEATEVSDDGFVPEAEEVSEEELVEEA